MTIRVVTVSTVTCPACGARQREAMPLFQCDRIHYCFTCGTVARSALDVCCVYCAWGDVPCPSSQRARQLRPPDDRELEGWTW